MGDTMKDYEIERADRLLIARGWTAEGLSRLATWQLYITRHAALRQYYRTHPYERPA